MNWYILLSLTSKKYLSKTTLTSRRKNSNQMLNRLNRKHNLRPIGMVERLILMWWEMCIKRESETIMLSLIYSTRMTKESSSNHPIKLFIKLKKSIIKGKLWKECLLKWKMSSRWKGVMTKSGGGMI